MLSDCAFTIAKCAAASAGKPRYAISFRKAPSGPSTSICTLAQSECPMEIAASRIFSCSSTSSWLISYALIVCSRRESASSASSRSWLTLTAASVRRWCSKSAATRRSVVRHTPS